MYKEFFDKKKTDIFGVDLEFRGRRSFRSYSPAGPSPRSRVVVAESARFSRRLLPFRQSFGDVRGREPRERPSTYTVYARPSGRRHVYALLKYNTNDIENRDRPRVTFCPSSRWSPRIGSRVPVLRRNYPSCQSRITRANESFPID